MPEEIDIIVANQSFVIETNETLQTKVSLVIVHVNSKIEVEEEAALKKIIFTDFHKKTGFKITFQEVKEDGPKVS